jgi:hypothetical protein
MKKIIKYSILLITMSLFLSACEKDFLETQPTNQVADQLAISSTANALKVLNGIHRSLYIRYETTQGNGGIGSHFIHLDCMGEDHVNNRNQWFNRVYQWTAGSSDTDFYSRFPYILYYHIIANANIILDGINADTQGTQEERDNLIGQALVYRAFSHYQLVQVYGNRYVPGGGNTQLGVPYKLTNSDEFLLQARNTVEEVYQLANDDLDRAILLLDGLARTNKSHISVAVARGLKARIALTQGQYSTAITFAKQARAGFVLMDQATYANGFRDQSENTSEFMWASQIIPDQTDTFANFGAFISRNFSSSAIRGNPRSISSELFNLISATDIRKTLWSEDGSHPNLPSDKEISSRHSRHPYTNQKFLSVSTGDSRMDVPLMRAAEMYLIEAEAEARGGVAAQGAQALFDLIATRDTAYTLSTSTGQALIDEIMIHRRIELWGEGFRFLDLKRLNLPLDRTGGQHTASLTGNVLQVPAGDLRWTWLIPREEINANPNIIQNPI